MTVLVAAILFIARSGDYSKFLILAFIIPVVSFWILDGYFLWRERLFRGIYNDVRKQNQTDFHMNIPEQLRNPKNTWPASIFSPTLNIFYLSEFFFIIVVFFVIKECN